MPPRKASRASSTGTSKRRRNEQGQTFFNDEARMLYEAQLSKREGIRERGINTTLTSMIDIIDHLQWSKFVVQPEPAIIPMVREFYANARIQLETNPEQRSILVRGRMVPIDHSTINQLFGLEDYESDEYSSMMQDAQDHDAENILRFIAKPGAKWKVSRGQIVNMQRSQLQLNAKGWHYFISARLLPTHHVSSVTKERAFLIHAIQKGLTINVGRIIERSIVAFATGRVGAGLGHPSLICQLCEIATVSYGPDEELQYPLPIIDDSVMEALEKVSITSHSHSETDPAFQPRADEAGPSTSQPPEPQDASLAALQKQVHDLRIETRRTLARHSRQLEYVVDVCKALVTAYQSGSTPQGSRSVFFPAAPSLSPYQSDASEEDPAVGSNED